MSTLPSGEVYNYIVFKAVAGQMQSGTFTGNGTDNRNITGIGFEPGFAWLRGNAGNSSETVFKGSSTGAGTDATQSMINLANFANGIQALQTDGFQVGTSAKVNANSQATYWTAFKGPVSTTTTLAVDKLLVTDPNPASGTVGTNIVVTMTVGSTAALTGVVPPTLALNKALGTASTATLISGTPANVNIAAGGTAAFSWTYRLDVASAAASWKENLTFSGTPTHPNATFGVATSPSVILTQPLTFTANVNSPAGVNQVLNQANFYNNAGLLATSPNSVTNLRGVIGNQVWADANNDGLLNNGEAGINGVAVQLFQQGKVPGIDAPDATTTTATVGPDAGVYSFTNVPPGDYFIYLPTPPPSAPLSSSVTDTADNAENNDDNGSQSASGQPVSSPVIAVAGGEIDNTIDFGFVVPATIGNQVFNDLNNNGLLDGAEVGIASVVVTLKDGSGNDVDSDPLTVGVQPTTSTTNASGIYSFSGLPNGNYQLVIATPPSGFPLSSTTTVGLDNQVNNDDNGAQTGGSGTLVSSPIIALAVGETDNTVDFGFWSPSSIGNLVWRDQNHNGLYDPGEPGISGLTVQLYGSTQTPGVDTPLATTSTNGSGVYEFPNLVPGSYIVYLPATPATLPSISLINNTGDDQIDNDNNGSQSALGGPVSSPIIAIGSGENDLTIDFGFACLGTWAEWQYLNPLGGQNGAADNPDVDAYDNLVEFSFAMPADSGVGNPYLIRPSASAPGTIEAVFVRPIGATQNVVYTLEYAATPGDPTSWQSIDIDIAPGMIAIVPIGNCYETVTIGDLESLPGMGGGKGIVRIRAELDSPSHISYTETEGWTETAFGLCCRTYNNPYLRETAFTGSIDAVNSQALDLTTATGPLDLAAVTATGKWFVEVTSGDNEGHRFDVVSATANSLTLANDGNLFVNAAPYNTLLGAVPANLAGDSIILRRHWTLNELFPPASFGANVDRDLADQVQLFADNDDPESDWTTYYLYDAGGTPRWVKTGDDNFADQGAAVLTSGQGMFFNNRTSPTSLLAYGEVRENDFIRPLAVGNDLVGAGYPVDQSAVGPDGAGFPVIPGGREMTLAEGFFGSRNFKTADSFFIWRGDATPNAIGYNTYFLLNRETVQPAQIKWVAVGDVFINSRDSDVLFLSDAAVFVRTKDSLPAYTVPSPWTP